MTPRPVTEVQIATALRAHLPATAPTGLGGRILAEARTQRQDRALPSVLGVLSDADPVARRRSLLIAAALLVALAVGTAAAVGALRIVRPPQLVPELSVDVPGDLVGLVDSTYLQLGQVPARLVVSHGDGTVSRIYLDGGTGVRVETYTDGEASPAAIQVAADGRRAGSVIFQGRRQWADFGPDDSPPWDPAYVAMTGLTAGLPCDVDWEHLGVELRIERPAHHVRCPSDERELWIDDATRLVLRSQIPLVDDLGTVPGRAQTSEVTELRFEPQPATLFELGPPAGIASLAIEQPPAAPVQDGGPADLDALVAMAIAVREGQAPFEATVDAWSSKYGSRSAHASFETAELFRVETTGVPQAGPPPVGQGSVEPPRTTIYAGHLYAYESLTRADGTTLWRNRSDRPGQGRQLAGDLRLAGLGQFLLVLPPECAAGWRHRGVDVVAGRLADHLECVGDFSCLGVEPATTVSCSYWIDRETLLVLRTASLGDPVTGAEVQEVRDLRFVAHPPSMFELPGDAVVLPRPTAVDGARPSPPPVPAGQAP